jgi:hypothetical protein
LRALKAYESSPTSPFKPSLSLQHLLFPYKKWAVPDKAIKCYKGIDEEEQCIETVGRAIMLWMLQILSITKLIISSSLQVRGIILMGKNFWNQARAFT